MESMRHSRFCAEPTSEPDHDCPPILRALARLADRDRDAILLIAWEELNIADASQVLGCSEVAFRVRLHRARRRLRALLADLTADTTAARPLTPLAQGDEP